MGRGALAGARQVYRTNLRIAISLKIGLKARNAHRFASAIAFLSVCQLLVSNSLRSADRVVTRKIDILNKGVNKTVFETVESGFQAIPKF